MIQKPQIAFDNGDSWSVVAGRARLTGFSPKTSMPEVQCPVIDTTQIDDHDRLGKLISKHIDWDGCSNPEKLVNELVSIGGRVVS